MTDLPPDDVLRHVVDVHCHPTDASRISSESMDHLQITVCAMASRESDQSLVRNLATAYPSKIVPCFGTLSPMNLSTGKPMTIYLRLRM